MAKEMWKPGNMLYPVPPVLVTCQNKKGESNMLTVAWAGTVCSTPAMLSISVRKERYSHAMLMETGEFVVNLPTEDLVRKRMRPVYVPEEISISGKNCICIRKRENAFRSHDFRVPGKYGM